MYTVRKVVGQVEITAESDTGKFAEDRALHLRDLLSIGTDTEQNIALVNSFLFCKPVYSF